jgi:hypothetical protein
MLKVAIASSKLAVMLVTPTNAGRPLGDDDGRELGVGNGVGGSEGRGLGASDGITKVVGVGVGVSEGVGVDVGVLDLCGLGLMLAAQPAKTTGGTRLAATGA